MSDIYYTKERREWIDYHHLRAALMGRVFGSMSYSYFFDDEGKRPDEFIDADTLEVITSDDLHTRVNQDYGMVKFVEWRDSKCQKE